MKARFFALSLALVLASMAASAQLAPDGRSSCTGGSDNATWNASASASTSVSVQGTTDLSVNMTSPTCLNSYSTFPGTLSVYADVALASSTCPDGTSGSSATCALIAPLASISNNPQQYSDFGQTQTYSVHFDASNATPGTYTFHVHANASDPDQQGLNQALNGFGWGYGGGTDLSVTVVEPKEACDPNDNLNVSFAKPSNGNQNFCNGGTSIAININANDTSNLITSLTASANGADITGSLATTGLNSTSVNEAGNYLASAVGFYKFEANAATACTTVQPKLMLTWSMSFPDCSRLLPVAAEPRAVPMLPSR